MDFSDSLTYIRLMFPEFKSVEDDMLEDLYDIAIDEVCPNGYSDKNLIKALALYTLYLYQLRLDRENGCVEEYSENVKSESINGEFLTAFGDREMVNGVKPLNNYHYLFLKVPNCDVNVSFMGVVSKGCCNNLHSDTDFCDVDHYVHREVKK